MTHKERARIEERAKAARLEGQRIAVEQAIIAKARQMGHTQALIEYMTPHIPKD